MLASPYTSSVGGLSKACVHIAQCLYWLGSIHTLADPLY